MQIVIEILEEEYEKIKSMYIHNNATAADLRRIIANGTPLETVLEDIKAEIEEEKQGYDLYDNDDNNVLYGLQTCIGIIDNHISRKENENDNSREK